MEDEDLVNCGLEDHQEWNSYKSMPEKFACALLSASSDKYRDLDLEFAYQALCEWEYYDYLSGESGKCICSHSITERYYIKNKITDQVAVVGSECIKKLKTGDLNLWAQINLSVKSRLDHKKYACCYCCKYKVDWPSSIPLCKSCKETGRTGPSKNYLTVMGVICTRCKETRILSSSSESWCESCEDRCRECENIIRQDRVQIGLCLCCEEEQQAKRIREEKQRYQNLSSNICISCRCSHTGKYKRCWTCYRLSTDRRSCSTCSSVLPTNSWNNDQCRSCWNRSKVDRDASLKMRAQIIRDMSVDK